MPTTKTEENYLTAGNSHPTQTPFKQARLSGRTTLTHSHSAFNFGGQFSSDTTHPRICFPNRASVTDWLNTSGLQPETVNALTVSIKNPLEIWPVIMVLSAIIDKIGVL